jgi:hypothetical protein
VTAEIGFGRVVCPTEVVVHAEEVGVQVSLGESLLLKTHAEAIEHGRDRLAFKLPA